MSTFGNLTEKLQQVFGKLTRKGRLTEEDVTIALKEVQLALLEADVHYKVVKDFVGAVKEKAIGQQVLESLTPGQMVIDLVHKELTSLLGTENKNFPVSSNKPFIILMAGLQGSGKTTTAGKLGYMFKAQQRKCYFIAADVYRPAAIDQLRTLARKMDLPGYFDHEDKDVLHLVKRGLEDAKAHQPDVIIIDTAGRQHLDADMMDELVAVKVLAKPDEVILVVDGMTGQDAVNIGTEFEDKIGIDSIAVTKMDGDARGGAVISLLAVTGKPIKLLGMGEKLDQLEYFHPDRIAGRILGMGDVLSLIEKAQSQFDADESKKLQQKIMESSFTLEDFLEQIRQMRKLGSMEDILSMLPGTNKLKSLPDERQLHKVEAIICSMTIKEREHPDLLGASRKKRIARGSGTEVSDINRLLKQFDQTKQMMKQFGNMGKKKRGGMPRLF